MKLMMLMMSLFGLVALLGTSGCVVRAHGGFYDDSYYHGYGNGYRYDHDHDGYYRNHYYHDYRY